LNQKIFYILNPHRDDFIWEPLYFRFIKRRALKKYNYIADIFSENTNVKLLISDKCSGIFPQSLLNNLPKILRRSLLRWEMSRWLKVNNLPTDTNYFWLDNKLEIATQDEVFMFQLSNEKLINGVKRELEKFKNVFVHLSHYYLYPKQISATFKNLSNLQFCGDSDVSEHSFFKRYFGWYSRPFNIIPFCVADKFKVSGPNQERVHKIISTGTFHPIEEYSRSYYMKDELGVNAFHYNRRNIFENKETLVNSITCYNSPWKQKDASWIKKIWNASLVAQKSYFQLDIVKEYNSFKFALIGEEICGFPGIGTFEALACGCTPIVNISSIQGIGDINELQKLVIINNELDIIKNAIDLQALLQKESGEKFVDKYLRAECCKANFEKLFGL
jgi:glycosyltransferase involved in cell wall biosynthesis